MPSILPVRMPWVCHVVEFKLFTGPRFTPSHCPCSAGTSVAEEPRIGRQTVLLYSYSRCPFIARWNVFTSFIFYSSFHLRSCMFHAIYIPVRSLLSTFFCSLWCSCRILYHIWYVTKFLALKQRSEYEGVPPTVTVPFLQVESGRVAPLEANVLYFFQRTCYVGNGSKKVSLEYCGKCNFASQQRLSWI